MESQTEGQHQEEKQHHDADQRPHDLPKHHHKDADVLKPGMAGDQRHQLTAQLTHDMKQCSYQSKLYLWR